MKTNIMREIPSGISQLSYIVLKFLGLLQSPENAVCSILDAALASPVSISYPNHMLLIHVSYTFTKFRVGSLDDALLCKSFFFILFARLPTICHVSYTCHL